MKKRICSLALLLCLLIVSFSAVGCDKTNDASNPSSNISSTEPSTKFAERFPGISDFTHDSSLSLSEIPEFGSVPWVEINDNKPDFTDNDYTTFPFEHYSDLDELGRCGECYACIGEDIMPTEERGAIGMVKPSGWKMAKYDCVDGKYLYNRCHLIGYQLTGENANVKNLITGTRYLNVEGMLPFENKTAEYVHRTKNHVLYRVTPIFEGNNLVASGVQMEGYSVEDAGEGLCFNVYCYNAQPGVGINYSDGSSWLLESAVDTSPLVKNTYVLNTYTKKFHLPNCSSVKDIQTKNKKEYTGERTALISDGYEPCKNCNP